MGWAERRNPDRAAKLRDTREVRQFAAARPDLIRELMAKTSAPGHDYPTIRSWMQEQMRAYKNNVDVPLDYKRWEPNPWPRPE